MCLNIYSTTVVSLSLVLKYITEQTVMHKYALDNSMVAHAKAKIICIYPAHFVEHYFAEALRVFASLNLLYLLFHVRNP